MENDRRECRFAPTALMFGNVVTGMSVLAPAGMLGELSSGLRVTISGAALLITFGAVVLCIGSPLTAWLTSRIERRTLLTEAIGGQLFARDQFRGVGYVAVAFVMLALAAVFLTRPRQPARSN
jgi:predicted MFS family arabinose efflux permease